MAFFGIPPNLLLLGGAGVSVLAFLILVIAGIALRIKKDSKDVFEQEDIEKLIKPEIRNLIDYWGSSVSMKLRYRYDEKGTIYKQLDSTEDVEGNLKDVDGASIDIDEEQLEEDFEKNRINRRTYKMIKKFSEEPVHVLLVRPSGLSGKIKYIVSELVFNSSKNIERMIIVPERLIRDDVDYLTIKNQAEFSRFAGMDVAVEASAFNFVQSIGFKNLYSQALQDQQNYHKQVNFYASRFSQKMQKLEKEAEIEKERSSRGSASNYNYD